jgi:integrase
MATRLGVETTLHKLRHYSATELMAACVDIHTIARRLGRDGGGTTTLGVYARLGQRSGSACGYALGSRMKRPGSTACAK